MDDVLLAGPVLLSANSGEVLQKTTRINIDGILREG
jgi:hypothetical protein